MSRWTETELAALRVAGRDYRRFVELTGGTKSYDAFEVKSRRVALTESATAPVASRYGKTFWAALLLTVGVAMVVALVASAVGS